MKRTFFSSVVSMVLVCLFAFSGCEEGLTSNDGSDPEESGFSFSDMYEKIDTLQEKVERLTRENNEQKEIINKLSTEIGILGGDQASSANSLSSKITNLESIVNSLVSTVGNDSSGLVSYFAALQGTVNSHTTAINSHSNSISNLNIGVSTLNTTLTGVSRLIDPNTGKTTIRFSGVNVQIVNGTNTTSGDVNGLGNLIVGYNEERTDWNATNNRSGSHNLIVGSMNNYTSCGGFIAGYNNTIGYMNGVRGGNYSLAIGISNIVSGNNSIAIGHGSRVSGYGSGAIGIADFNHKNPGNLISGNNTWGMTAHFVDVIELDARHIDVDDLDKY